MAKRNKDTSEKRKRQSARVPKLESLGKYQVEREIGAGGMGAVFLARDTTLNRLAALKVLPRDKAENPVLVKRFKAEGQAAAHLRHENIVSVYDAGEEDGYLYIALEYVEGTDLHNLISKRNRIPIRRSLEIVTQVTEALAHAHQQGIVHRDIKPANILIRQDGVVKLTDLGLARSIDDNTETSITRAGTTVGTVDYMAPEQARDSKAADIRSDIYSLGCTWYHMLTGRAPFSEGSLTNKLAAHATTPPPDPRELNERVPEGIVAIIHRMMAKSKKDRYQTPEELLEDLKNSNLKRSNVDNNVLEALANESDGEQPTRVSDALPPADSSDFMINQFIPDYSSQTDDSEEHSGDGNQLSSSFDLQGLAEGIEIESGTTAPGLRQPLKNVSKNRSEREQVKPKPEKKRSNANSRRSEPEPETGSVISDSAMKVKKKKRQQISAPVETQSKRTRSNASEKQQSRKKSVKRPGSRKASRNAAPVETTADSTSEGQISIDFKQVGILLGGLVLVILLIWWGINAMNSSGGDPSRGPGSNPFANEESDRQAAMETPAADQDEQEVSTEANGAESSSEADTKQGEHSDTQPAPKASEKWENISVRGQEKKYLPHWGAGFSDLTGSSASRQGAGLPVLRVAQGKSVPGIWDSLDEAVEAVTDQGAVIRLYGQGPFLLSQHQLKKIPQLIIMAADSKQKRPTVLLQFSSKPGTPASGNDNLLTISSGVLRFQGVHLMCDASQISGSGECNILNIDQSDLTFQDSSFILTGESSRSIRLINSTGKPRTDTNRPEGESRILIENAVITGKRMNVVRIDQLFSDVFISNSYLSVTQAPCLVLESLQSSVNSRDLLQARQNPRTVRVFSSTLVSDETVFELTGPTSQRESSSSDNSETISAQTEFIIVNSVLLGNPEAKQSALLTLNRWPQDKLRKQSKSRILDLNLELDSVLFWGWPCYLRATSEEGPQGGFEADSHRTWQQCWGKTYPAESFHAEVPSRYVALRSPAFDKSLLDFSKVKPVYSVSTGGVIAGCDPQSLSSLTDGQQQRIQAYLAKPDLVKTLRQEFVKAKTVSFDMTKGNLNEFLNSTAVSGPTIVNVTGQGRCYTAPVELENKQVRLRFQSPTGGAQLIVELKLIPGAGQQRKSASRGSGIDSFFTLKNSALDIEGGKFRIASDRKGLIPRHFVTCQNSQLALRDSALDAMLINDNRFRSVIAVESGATKKRNQILLEKTYLSSSGTILESHAAQLDLDVRQSMFLSSKDIFALPLKSTSNIPVRVSLNQSTLAPQGVVFGFESSADKAMQDETAVQIFSDHSLFFPASSGSGTGSASSQTAALLKLPPHARKTKLVQWWGYANGYMVEHLEVLREPGDFSSGSSSQFQDTLSKLFGTEAEQHALAMPGGILFEEQKLPPLVKIQPRYFKLLPACKAAIWSDLKQPLGADPVDLQSMIEGKGQDDPQTGRKKRAF